MVGVCITKIKRWLGKEGNSFETSIERLQTFTDQPLLNHQVCVAVVRMLWHSGPLAVKCKDHLVVNRLKTLEVLQLLRVIGLKECVCPEFNRHAAAPGDFVQKWCFGNREGSTETDRGWDDVEEEYDEADDDDGNDDRQAAIAQLGAIL